MKDNKLVTSSRAFAVNIVRTCVKIKNESGEQILTKQLIRSGTSVGANIHEANYASSRADFINKFRIALKECHETEYWLLVLKETDYLSVQDYETLYSQCSKIKIMLTASVKTASGNS